MIVLPVEDTTPDVPPEPESRRRARWRVIGPVAMAAAVTLVAVAPAGLLRPSESQRVGSGMTFYVSPTGSDGNPGTALAPWKSMYWAARVAHAGDTVIFADGVYNETIATRFTSGGLANYPVVFRAANKRKAKIHYVGTNWNTARLRIDKPYITIKDFEIYGDPWVTARTSDVMLSIDNDGDHARSIGNKIHTVYEDAIKASDVTDLIVDDNLLSNTAHEGFDAVNVANSVVRNTSVSGIGRTGMNAKGGSRNLWFVNNTISNPRAGATGVTALSLGGVTISTSTYSTSGYEGYRIAAVNNIIYSATPGAIGTGLSIRGCADCAGYHNALVGVTYPVVINDGGDPNGSTGGTPWTAHTRNPTFVNNIATECTARPFAVNSTVEGTLNHDYNLYYNCPNLANQAHGIGDPKFVNKWADWHLQAGSPGINSGTPLTTFPVYTDANTPAVTPLDLRLDRTGVLRSGAWDLGPYNVATP